MDRSPLIEYYRKGLFLNYRREYTEYYNEHTKSQNANEDIYFLSVQLQPKWFGVEEWYYDGHTIKTVTILGISFGKGYSYQWENLG